MTVSVSRSNKESQTTIAQAVDLPVTLVIGPPGSGKTALLSQCLAKFPGRVAVLCDDCRGAGRIDVEILHGQPFSFAPTAVGLFSGGRIALADRLSLSSTEAQAPTRRPAALLIELSAGDDVAHCIQRIAMLVAQTPGCYLNGVLAVLAERPSDGVERSPDALYVALANAVWPNNGDRALVEQQHSQTRITQSTIRHPRIMGEDDLHLIFGALGADSCAYADGLALHRAVGEDCSDILPMRVMHFFRPLDSIKTQVLFHCISHFHSHGTQRIKGLVWIDGSECKLIVQGEGGRFHFQTGRPWGADELRHSTFCCWGAEWLPARLNRGLQSCEISQTLH